MTGRTWCNNEVGCNGLAFALHHGQESIVHMYYIYACVHEKCLKFADKAEIISFRYKMFSGVFVDVDSFFGL